jgi:hypothetical protein
MKSLRFRSVIPKAGGPKFLADKRAIAAMIPCLDIGTVNILFKHYVPVRNSGHLGRNGILSTEEAIHHHRD